MKERPILFSAPMVRALLDGSKTQTRRVVKMPPSWDCVVYADWGNGFWPYASDDGESPTYDNIEVPMVCPYGQPGDRLWVRETFMAYGRWVTRFSEKKRRDEWHFIDMTEECDRRYQYAADNPDVPLSKARGATPGWYMRPAIFMPREASRILREIASVRVERLNDISEADAISEGIEQMPCNVPDTSMWRNYRPENGWTQRVCIPQNSFRSLWESINGEEGWISNPWVWRVEFKRVAP